MFTYHKEIPKPDAVTSSAPHNFFSLELRTFFEEKNCVQERYYFKDNGFYFFIYLDNGDRIDVKL